jgi:tRNA (adenine57-N1/adenine58-N1)-methyltransferase
MDEEQRSGEATATRGPFREGDLALLISRKGRRHLLQLDAAKLFETHTGILPHSGIIGQEVGSRLLVGGQKFLALRPTLAEYVQEAGRSTQIIYPKDVGPILVYGDIFPGARVLEAGLGSGMLTLALLRATGPRGSVTTYELRPELIERGKSRVRAVLPDVASWTVRHANVYAGIQERDLDRIILDVPEPWQVVDHAAETLVPGGILLSFLPTALQIHRLVGALDEHPNFDLVDTFEVMLRPWFVSRRSVRPQHRMVAHTGFITTARKCAAGKIRVPERTGDGFEDSSPDSP